MVYYCEGCEEHGDSSFEIKHKPECKNKVVKVCMKSGTAPHLGDGK